jgi:hypothetical protein
LDFKEKLLEKGKRETGETLLRKVKVSKPFQSSPPLVRSDGRQEYEGGWDREGDERGDW